MWYNYNERIASFGAIVLPIADESVASVVRHIFKMRLQTLGMSDNTLVIAEAAMRLDGLAGGIIAGAAAQKMRLKDGYITLIICSIMAFLMGIALLNSVPPIAGYIIITAASFGTMCTSTMFTVTLFTAVQQQTPPLLLGKIMAVIIAVSSCSQPLGQAVYGVLFDVLSEIPYAVMIGAAVISFVVALCSKKIFARLEDSSQ